MPYSWNDTEEFAFISVTNAYPHGIKAGSICGLVETKGNLWLYPHLAFVYTETVIRFFFMACVVRVHRYYVTDLGMPLS